MSLVRNAEIECMRCHKRTQFILHSSINVGIDPQDKEKVLDMSIFQYQCKHCGSTDIACYPLLYHDPIQGVWIWVYWREEDFGKQLDKELEEFIKIMGHEHYRRREVFGYWELIEKIRIFDAGLDDFAIAMMKTMYKIQNPEGPQLIFDEKKGKQLRFLRIRNNMQLAEGAAFDEKAYVFALKLAEQRKKPHEIYEDLRVDESYFYNDIMNALQSEER